MNIDQKLDRRIRTEGPWTPDEEKELVAIARRIPDLYQNPCQPGNVDKFNDIRDQLSKKGIKKTTEQIRRIWKEKLCDNIIPGPGIQEHDQDILRRLYLQHGGNWSFLSEEYCRLYGQREGQTTSVYHPHNRIRNFFTCNKKGRNTSSSLSTLSNEFLDPRSTPQPTSARTSTKKRKADTNFSQKSSSQILQPTHDLKSSSSSFFNDLIFDSPCTTLPPTNKIQKKTSYPPSIEPRIFSVSTSTISDKTLPEHSTDQQPSHTEIASNHFLYDIQQRIAQGNSREHVLMPYSDRSDFRVLCSFFEFLERVVPDLLRINMSSINTQLKEYEARLQRSDEELTALIQRREELKREYIKERTESLEISKNPFEDPVPQDFFTSSRGTTTATERQEDPEGLFIDFPPDNEPSADLDFLENLDCDWDDL